MLIIPYIIFKEQRRPFRLLWLSQEALCVCKRRGNGVGLLSTWRLLLAHRLTKRFKRGSCSRSQCYKSLPAPLIAWFGSFLQYSMYRFILLYPIRFVQKMSPLIKRETKELQAHFQKSCPMNEICKELEVGSK